MNVRSHAGVCSVLGFQKICARNHVGESDLSVGRAPLHTFQSPVHRERQKALVKTGCHDGCAHVLQEAALGIAVYESDVFIPIEVVFLSVDLLRQQMTYVASMPLDLLKYIRPGVTPLHLNHINPNFVGNEKVGATMRHRDLAVNKERRKRVGYASPVSK